MATLLHIREEIAHIKHALDEIEGDATAEAVDALNDYLATLTEDLDAKVDNYAGLIREFELTAAARNEEAERIKKAAVHAQNKADYLRNRLKQTLESLGVKKAGKLRTCAVTGNGGKTPLDIRTAPEDMPTQYQRVRIEADTDAIRKALESGQQLPFANLMERGTHLRIR